MGVVAMHLYYSAAPAGPVEPGEAKGLLEILGAVLGVTKWPVLGLAVVAAAIAMGNYSSEKQQQSLTFKAAFVVACFAGGWFLAGLADSA